MNLEKRILIVEDHPTTMIIIEKMLLSLGFEEHYILKATNGIYGLELFQRHNKHIHLVITDWNMPGMNGIELTRKIRILNKTVPILMGTSKSSSPEVLLAKQVGITSFLVKPLQIDTLKTKLEQYLK